MTGDLSERRRQLQDEADRKQHRNGPAPSPRCESITMVDQHRATASTECAARGQGHNQPANQTGGSRRECGCQYPDHRPTQRVQHRQPTPAGPVRRVGPWWTGKKQQHLDWTWGGVGCSTSMRRAVDTSSARSSFSTPSTPAWSHMLLPGRSDTATIRKQRSLISIASSPRRNVLVPPRARPHLPSPKTTLWTSLFNGVFTSLGDAVGARAVHCLGGRNARTLPAAPVD